MPPTEWSAISPALLDRLAGDWELEALRLNNEAVRVLMGGALAEAQQRGILRLQDLIETQAFTNLPWLIALGFLSAMYYALLQVTQVRRTSA